MGTDSLSVLKWRAKRSASIVAEVIISFRSGLFRQKLFEIPQKKVDIQAAFMSFIDRLDRIVLFQKTVALRFGQKNAIRHQFDRCLGTQFVGEAEPCNRQFHRSVN